MTRATTRLHALLVVATLAGAATAWAAPNPYEWTALTHRAVKAYSPQISRSDVITALGPPAFAVTQNDGNEIAAALSADDVVLVWNNGDRCEPIFIGFRNDVAVGGKLGQHCAPGAALALKAKWNALEWVTARCIHPDRRSLCSPARGAVSHAPSTVKP